MTSWVKRDLIVICKAFARLEILGDLLGVQALVSQSLVRLGPCAVSPHSAGAVQPGLILTLTAEGIQLGCTRIEQSSGAVDSQKTDST